MISIFIEPHERYEAIDAYRPRLTAAQISEITEAPESAIVQLRFAIGGPAQIIIIEEG